VIRLPLIVVAFVVLWWALLRVCKRKSLRIAISVFAALLSIVLGLLLVQWGWELSMMLRARHIAAQLESYRGLHGQYPVSLLDIAGAPLNGPIHYERDLQSPDVYYLWFGTGFGTVSQYDSKTQSWHGPQ
jgi:hypothetical protein